MVLRSNRYIEAKINASASIVGSKFQKMTRPCRLYSLYFSLIKYNLMIQRLH